MTAIARCARTLLLPVSLLFSAAPLAGTWIKSVESCESCVVERDGQRLQALPLMPLQEDDKVSIKGDDVKVVLVDSADRQITLDAGQRHYRVTEKAAGNGLSEAVSHALDWFRRASASLLPGRSMITAGEQNPAQINGMDADANKVSNDLGRVVFVWDFGQPPFTASILDRDGKRVFEKQTGKQKLPVSLDQLPAGNYRFVLASRFDGETVSDDYPFSVVDSAELPDEFNELGEMDMPGTIRTLHEGVALARYPEWRFMALQMAIQVKDRSLARALLEEESH